MTDHGNLHGAIEFYQEAKRIGIKPILGCELYVAPNGRSERKTRENGGESTCHLTIMARDRIGYQNLCRLSTLAYREGFYFKPRVDWELLARYSEGLIILSGCLAGELGEAGKRGDREKAKQVIEFYANTFKDRYYIELQPHRIPEQQRHNAFVLDLASEFGLPVIGTTDCHYLEKGDHFAQEVLMCISTGKSVTDPTRLKHEGVALHLKTATELRAEFGETARIEEAIQNTIRVSEECDIVFDFKTHYMPQFKSDDDSETKEPLIDLMAALAREGLEKRLRVLESRSDWNPALKQAYSDRLEEEIRLIGQMGFAGYFLVVSDFIVWAKENGIPVGPGRGSAAGSLVAYALRITELDPITHKCLFERFLNPERVSLPDIDVDFCINGRDQVIRYVVEKYGKEQVAQIATFGTLKAKAAIKDVGRALGMSYAETDRVAQLVPAPRQGFDYPLEEALKMEPRLKEYADGPGKELIQLAIKLEGLTRHSSTHAAGVVIGDRPLMELLPLMVDKDGNDVTQYSMSYVEKVGLVKFDFLGLKTLTVLNTAVNIVKESRGITIDLNNLALEDSKTYDILCAGNTTGVFQLESTGITEMVIRLKPSCFDDLVAILALYRPGPLDAGMVDHYIDRKHGREPISYLHPLMERTLADTYGVIVYQEQIMQLARELAGYSLGEADLLRRAMGKKNPEEMAAQQGRFVSGAVKQGIPNKLASEIFQQMETFARYGFNRSHSAAYALISFQTAYMKAHYGVEFMAALMSHEMEDSDKTFKNLNECRKQGIKVLPPDVNQSGSGFTVRGGLIRFGLAAVKGTGEKAVDVILKAREKGGDFTSIEDLVSRIEAKSINRRVFENLIKAGAFDISKVSRRELIDRLDEILKTFQVRVEDKRQLSLFGSVEKPSVVTPKVLGLAEWPVNQRLSFEREALGFFISGHPLEKFRSDLKRFGAISTADVKNGGKREVRVGGIVSALKLKNTKKGDRYASLMLEDWVGTIEALVWPETYKRVSHFLISEEPVIATGKPDITEERAVLIIDKIESLISMRDRSATQGFLVLAGSDDVEQVLPRFQNLFSLHPGTCPLKVKLALDTGEVLVVLKDAKNAPICVEPSEGLCEKAEQIIGRPVLSFV
jgi:DNA polymerase-3 subunit alpha